MTITLRRTHSGDPAFRTLVAELDADLWRRYGELQAQYAPHNVIEALGTVVIALDGEAAVGCGCFKASLPDAVELKRVFVAPGARGRGVATRVIGELERWACELGFAVMQLETGPDQPEALALYEKLGFTRIDAFGPYRELPASICMAKPLG